MPLVMLSVTWESPIAAALLLGSITCLVQQCGLPMYYGDPEKIIQEKVFAEARVHSSSGLRRSLYYAYPVDRNSVLKSQTRRGSQPASELSACDSTVDVLVQRLDSAVGVLVQWLDASRC